MEQSVSNKKRMFHILIILVIAWFSIIIKLFMIQIISTKDYSSNHINLLDRSVQQRKQAFVLSSGRGNIYDRNMQSLIEQREIQTLIVFPFSYDMLNEVKMKQLANIVDIDFSRLIEQLKEVNKPTYLKKANSPIEITEAQRKEITQLNLPSVVITTYTIQDTDHILAKHLVGYLGQAPEVIKNQFGGFLERGILETDSLIGRSGLQLSFQELLMGVGESKIAYYVDNQGHPLNGLASKMLIQEDAYYPLSLVTTIDKDIQAIALRELEKNNVKDGSVVILDPNSADVLTMASTPDFQLDNVNPNSPDWNNKAIKVAEPGSIFKTVIAIAALQEGVVTPNEKFFCDGKIEDYHFSCYKEHGALTFEEGYAESCNIVFAEVGKRLGPEKIQQYAESLGLVGKVGWSGEFFNNETFQQLANEDANRVFHPNTNLKDTGSIIRTAIGQQDVRVSPLAAANLVVTVINDGEVFQPRVVDKVIYKNGIDYYSFPIHKSDWSVGNKGTYREVKRMMEKVVDEGTGQYLKYAAWDLAGKTGTAETLNDLNNQWFIGYGPTDNPKYAIAVVVRNVEADLTARKVFKGIVDSLARME